MSSLLRIDCSLNGGLWRNNGWDMQDGYVPPGIRRVSGMCPRINAICLRVSLYPKYFNDAIPNRPALKFLCYRDTLQMFRLHAVKLVNHVPKFLNMGRVCHATASSNSISL